MLLASEELQVFSLKEIKSNSEDRNVPVMLKYGGAKQSEYCSLISEGHAPVAVSVKFIFFGQYAYFKEYASYSRVSKIGEGKLSLVHSSQLIGYLYFVKEP